MSGSEYYYNLLSGKCTAGWILRQFDNINTSTVSPKPTQSLFNTSNQDPTAPSVYTGSQGIDLSQYADSNGNISSKAIVDAYNATIDPVTQQVISADAVTNKLLSNFVDTSDSPNITTNNFFSYLSNYSQNGININDLTKFDINNDGTLSQDEINYAKAEYYMGVSKAINDSINLNATQTEETMAKINGETTSLTKTDLENNMNELVKMADADGIVLPNPSSIGALNGMNFIQNNLQSIESYATTTTSISISASTTTTTTVTNSSYYMDAADAFKLFTQIQNDQGVATPGGDGSDFSVQAIMNDLALIENKLNANVIDGGKDLTSNQVYLSNIEDGFLRAVVNADSPANGGNGDGNVTATELNNYLADNNYYLNFNYTVPSTTSTPGITISSVATSPSASAPAPVITDEATAEFNAVNRGESFLVTYFNNHKSVTNSNGTVSLDATDASKLFDLAQDDLGLAVPGSDGTDFSVGVIQGEIGIIENTLAASTSQNPLTQSQVSNYENLEGFLTTLVNKVSPASNPTSDSVITATDLENYLASNSNVMTFKPTTTTHPAISTVNTPLINSQAFQGYTSLATYLTSKGITLDANGLAALESQKLDLNGDGRFDSHDVAIFNDVVSASQYVQKSSNWGVYMTGSDKSINIADLASEGIYAYTVDPGTNTPASAPIGINLPSGDSDPTDGTPIEVSETGYVGSQNLNMQIMGIPSNNLNSYSLFVNDHMTVYSVNSTTGALTKVGVDANGNPIKPGQTGYISPTVLNQGLQSQSYVLSDSSNTITNINNPSDEALLFNPNGGNVALLDYDLSSANLITNHHLIVTDKNGNKIGVDTNGKPIPEGQAGYVSSADMLAGIQNAQSTTPNASKPEYFLSIQASYNYNLTPSAATNGVWDMSNGNILVGTGYQNFTINGTTESLPLFKGLDDGLIYRDNGDGTYSVDANNDGTFSETGSFTGAAFIAGSSNAESPSVTTNTALQGTAPYATAANSNSFLQNVDLAMQNGYAVDSKAAIMTTTTVSTSATTTISGTTTTTPTTTTSISTTVSTFIYLATGTQDAKGNYTYIGSDGNEYIQNSNGTFSYDGSGTLNYTVKNSSTSLKDFDPPPAESPLAAACTLNPDNSLNINLSSDSALCDPRFTFHPIATGYAPTSIKVDDVNGQYNDVLNEINNSSLVDQNGNNYINMYYVKSGTASSRMSISNLLAQGYMVCNKDTGDSVGLKSVQVTIYVKDPTKTTSVTNSDGTTEQEPVMTPKVITELESCSSGDNNYVSPDDLQEGLANGNFVIVNEAKYNESIGADLPYKLAYSSVSINNLPFIQMKEYTAADALNDKNNAILPLLKSVNGKGTAVTSTSATTSTTTPTKTTTTSTTTSISAPTPTPSNGIWIDEKDGITFASIGNNEYRKHQHK